MSGWATKSTPNRIKTGTAYGMESFLVPDLQLFPSAWPCTTAQCGAYATLRIATAKFQVTMPVTKVDMTKSNVHAVLLGVGFVLLASLFQHIGDTRAPLGRKPLSKDPEFEKHVRRHHSNASEVLR
mgnify:CR=1 FL=1